MAKFCMEFEFEGDPVEKIVYDLEKSEDVVIFEGFIEKSIAFWKSLSPEQKDQLVDTVSWKYLNDFEEDGKQLANYCWYE